MVDIKEITEEFTKLSSSDMGKVRFEENFDKKNHADEIETAEWICEKFGGDILLLCESKKQNEQMPDYLWRDRYWERKGIVSSKVNTVHQRIKKAYSQIDGKRGGVILDFSKGNMAWSEIEKAVKWSLIRAARGSTDVIMIKCKEYKVYQVTKK